MGATDVEAMLGKLEAQSHDPQGKRIYVDEALERRIARLEEGCISGVASATDSAHNYTTGSQNLANETQPPRAEVPVQVGPSGPAAVDDAMQAVRELEAVLCAELQGMHARWGQLQESIDGGRLSQPNRDLESKLHDALDGGVTPLRDLERKLQEFVDDRAVFPLRDLERRLQEVENMVGQAQVAGQECSSRIEEHEFRLGVSRTKLELQEDKLNRVFASRWQQPYSTDGGSSAECSPASQSQQQPSWAPSNPANNCANGSGTSLWERPSTGRGGLRSSAPAVCGSGFPWSASPGCDGSE